MRAARGQLRVARRGSGRQPDLAPVLDRLAAERRTMAALLDELRVVLATPVAGPDALGREVDRLTSQVRAHLAYEEEQLVPILNAAGE
ncbi:hemerythrin domain-containing protein [Micromonospora sp. CPCC 205556]|uniref:hemerythrin domain-containing protein n=1 Tax=Micromonospora sp. CPCC 205556 TaxID=3122398 RepID=UPI002FF20BB6